MSIGWKFLCFLVVFSAFSSFAQAEKKCILCDDSNRTDEKCAKEPTTLTETCTPTSSCFISVASNGKVKRGCIDASNTCATDDKSCRTCTPEDDKAACNSDVISLTCKSCDSSTDANCAQLSNPTAIKSVLCDSGITKCLMQIKDDKNIERRCVTKNDETCVADKNCETCETSGCNSGVYPTTRRRCYQCDASSECASLTSTSSLPCTLYDPADKCYVYGTSETSMARGCVSSATDFQKCSATNEKCVQCSTDNCNNSGYKRSQSLKCIQCTSDQATCAWGFSTNEAKDCTKQIEYYKTESCYTKKTEDTKVQRGCTHDVDNFECSTGCTQCTLGSGCNNADAMDFKCYKCRSDENPKCSGALEGTSYPSESCRNPVTESTAGCYTENWDGIIIRSCLVDADYTSMQQCLSTSYKKCESCTEKNCNSLKAPNSATAMTLTGALLAVTLLVLRFL